ncbi:MAG: preprotein translocase subunit SecE [Alphaproteobacteria bacterium]|nr:preprotein translocase subunit SecE [Alphaproteobacteria bacterium]
MAKFAPIEFFKQVKGEAGKITWPTRKETMATTFAVFIMVLIVTIFLYVADQLFGWLIGLILDIGN